MKKSLIAVSVLAVLAAGGWAGTTTYIKMNAEAQLEKVVSDINAKLESSALQISSVVPKLILTDVRSTFSQTTFNLELIIDNPEKHFFSDPYEMSDVSFKDLPATISLMKFENHAKHGPFPNISSFDFTPALMLIDTQGFITKLPKRVTTSLADKSMMNGVTKVGLTGGFNSQINWLENQIHHKLSDDRHKEYIDFKGARLDISAGKALSDLNIDFSINPFDLIGERISDDQEQPSENIIKFGEYKFAFNSEGQRVTAYLYPKTSWMFDFKGVTLNNSDDYSAIDARLEPITGKGEYLINDKQFDQLVKIEVGGLNIKLKEPQFFSEDSTSYNVSLKPFSIDLNSKDSAGGMLQYFQDIYAATEKYNRTLRDVRLAEGDNSTKVGFETLDYLLKIYGSMANFTGVSTATVSPLNIHYKEEKISDQTSTVMTDRSVELKPITTKYSRPTPDDKHDFEMNFEEVKFSDLVSKFGGALENASLKFEGSRKGIVPDLSVGIQFGQFKLGHENVNLLAIKDYSQRSSISETDSVFGYGEHYSLGNLNLLGLDFGSAEIKANLGNFDSKAVSNITNILKDKLSAIIENPGDYRLMSSLSMTLLPEVKNLLSHGVTFTLSPVQAKNSTGQANLDFDLKLKPLDPLALTLASKDPTAIFDSLVDNFSLKTSIDKAFIGDMAAKIEALSRVDNPTQGVSLDKQLMEETSQTVQQILEMAVMDEPVASIVKNQDGKLGLSFDYKNNTFNLNGQPKTLEEIMSALELLSALN